MMNVPDYRGSDEIQPAIKIVGNAVRGHLGELVRSTGEETLNQLLDAEADPLYGRNARGETLGSVSRSIRHSSGFLQP